MRGAPSQPARRSHADGCAIVRKPPFACHSFGDMPRWGDCLRDIRCSRGFPLASVARRKIHRPARVFALQPWRSDAPRPLGLATACYEVSSSRCNGPWMATERYTLSCSLGALGAGVLFATPFGVLSADSHRMRLWPACSTVRTRAASCSSPCRALEPLRPADSRLPHTGAGSAQDEQVGRGLARLCAAGPAARPGCHGLVGQVSLPQCGTGPRWLR